MTSARSVIERSFAAVLVVGGFISAAPSVPAAEKVPAATVLAALPISGETRDGYSRDLFRHWTIDPATGCDTRDVVLINERVAGTVRGCSVAGGVWRSAYDGVTTSNPSSFDIDHVVPLAEAWDSGAWRWSSGTRQAFANDLGYPGSLIAVTASSNRSKSDQDPSEWLPLAGRCTYAKQWIAVKFRWRLAVDATEKSAINRILAGCPPLMTLPTRASITTASAPARPSSGASSGSGRVDPRFGTCGEANSAGYGPYVEGRDPEYDWYIDRDSDGVVCET